MTEEEKENLRVKALQRIENAKKAKISGAGGDDNSANKGGDGSIDGGVHKSGGGDGKPSGDKSAGAGGRAGDDSKGKAAGRKISKTTQAVQIIVNQDKFLNGLPWMVRWHLKAAGKLLAIWNILPLPLKLEIEPLDKEEADSVAAAIRPGLEASLPNIGKKWPIWSMVYTLAVVALAKIKATFTWRPKVKVDETKPRAQVETKKTEDD